MPTNCRQRLDRLEGFSLAIYGAVAKLTDLIWDHGGAVRDDDRLIANHLDISLLEWRKTVRPAMIMGRFFVIKDGAWRSPEVDKALRWVAQHAGRRAAAKARAERENVNEISARPKKPPEKGENPNEISAAPPKRETMSPPESLPEVQYLDHKPQRQTVYRSPRARAGLKTRGRMILGRAAPACPLARAGLMVQSTISRRRRRNRPRPPPGQGIRARRDRRRRFRGKRRDRDRARSARIVAASSRPSAKGAIGVPPATSASWFGAARATR